MGSGEEEENEGQELEMDEEMPLEVFVMII